MANSSIWRGRRTPFGTDLLFADESNPGVVRRRGNLRGPVDADPARAASRRSPARRFSSISPPATRSSARRAIAGNSSPASRAAALPAMSTLPAASGESTTDLVFGGHALIAENGIVLAESPRFQRDDELLVSDIDVDRLQNDRQKTNSFGDSLDLLRDRPFSPHSVPACKNRRLRLVRPVDAHPFVPRRRRTSWPNAVRRHLSRPGRRAGQTAGAHRQAARHHRRLRRARFDAGPAGGLQDASTAGSRRARRSRRLTMPGFGTTRRTRANALALMQHLGVAAREIDIRLLCLEEMRALGHRPFGIALDGLDGRQRSRRSCTTCRRSSGSDLVFENVQARMRTSLLMNTRLRHRHRRSVGAGPRLVHLQRRSHEHVQSERQHPQDAGEVPGALGRRERVRRRRAHRRCSTSSPPRSRRSCCRRRRTARRRRRPKA